jgi:hypothetical protein
MVNCEVPLNGVLAGRVHVHGLLAVRAHAGGVMLAVAGAARPLTVNVIATGKNVPPSGWMARE